MIVGSMELQLRLEGCESLKDKRRILRSLIDRIRRDFKVAVAEVDDHDLWGNATIGIACVSTAATHAESLLQHVVTSVEAIPALEIAAISRSVERFG